MPKKHRPAHPRHHDLSGDLPGDAELTATLMRRQLRVANGIAALFLLLILGLPLLNALWPRAMQARVIGFPLTWLILGVLLYPVTWALAAWFVRASERLEADDARLVRRGRSHQP